MMKFYSLLLLWLLAIIFSADGCSRPGIMVQHTESNIDSILGQKMPFDDCGREVLDSFQAVINQANHIEYLYRRSAMTPKIQADPGTYQVKTSGN